jgi:hypothetical protein
MPFSDRDQSLKQDRTLGTLKFRPQFGQCTIYGSQAAGTGAEIFFVRRQNF